MNSHLRCSKTLWQTLNAADVVGVNVIAVIWAGVEKVTLSRMTSPTLRKLSNKPGHPAAYEKSVSKLSFQNARALRYHDSNVD